MRNRFTSTWDALLASYWFLPGLMTLGSVLLASLLVWLDTGDDKLTWLRDIRFVYLNQPDGARSLLSTISGSMIGVAGVAFSITMVVLSLTSGQYGPRLLGNFMRDRGNQFVLGSFIGTFIYCLLVLRTIRSADEAAALTSFVPHLAVTFSVLLAAFNLGVFIYFIHHTAESIQASSIITNIAQSLEDLIKKIYPEERLSHERGLSDEALDLASSIPDEFDEDARSVPMVHSSYLQTVGVQRLISAAKEHGVIVKVPHRPGTFLVERRPLLEVWPGERLTEELEEKLRGAFTFGPRRTPLQDFDFLFDQLTEVALRALSPGINDPVTAIECINRIGEGFNLLASRKLHSPYFCDDEEKLRLIYTQVDIKDLVKNTFGPLRRFSGDNMMVSLHLLQTIAVLRALNDHPRLNDALIEQADLILEVAGDVLIEADLEEVRQAHREATSGQDALDPPVQKVGF